MAASSTAVTTVKAGPQRGKRAESQASHDRVGEERYRQECQSGEDRENRAGVQQLPGSGDSHRPGQHCYPDRLEQARRDIRARAAGRRGEAVSDSQGEQADGGGQPQVRLAPAAAVARDGALRPRRGTVRGPLLGQGDTCRTAQHQQRPDPDADRAGHRGRGARPVRRGEGGQADREQQGAQRRGGDLRARGPFTAQDRFPARGAHRAKEARPRHELQPAPGLSQVTRRARGRRCQGRVRREQESGAEHEYDGARHEEGRRCQRLDDALQDILLVACSPTRRYKTATYLAATQPFRPGTR